MKFKIKKIVSKYINRYKTRDPYLLASYLNIEIVEKPLGSISGAYLYLNKNRTIFINSTLDCKFKTVVLAHELGHAILHPKENCYFMKNKTLLLTSKIEKQANTFASELLLKDDIFNYYQGFSLEYISICEYVPVDLLKIKLETLDY